jgi:hypothetical protein
MEDIMTITLKPTLLHATALAVLVLISSCKVATPDPRTELARSLKGANVEGYQFGVKEDDAFVVTSLTNGAVRDVMKIGDEASRTPLQYTRVLDKKSKAENLYRTEVVRDATSLALVVTDMASDVVASRRPFPAPDKTPPPPPASGFDSLQQCIADFHCEHGGQLQCEANRTCQDQLAALTCCLKSGDCYSVHLVIKPTTPRCQIRDLVPQLEGLVLTQR